MGPEDPNQTLRGDLPPDTRVLDEHELDQARNRAEGLQRGDVLDDVYELTGVRGSGGMGTVYLARDRHLEREVAIKVIHADKLGDPRVVESFLAEARAMARVHHPNVVTIYSFGARQGQPYLVMERVPGDNLAVWRRRRGRLSPADAVVVLDPLCRGAQAIHDAGTIHRDLKPGNVLIGPTHRVAITDFGLARPVDHGDFGPSVLAGTPAYLAPEIARGDALKPAHATRIDIYALAVMAFELLTGQPPYPGPTVTALLQQHAFHEPPRPSEVCPDVPGAFDAPLLAALAKSPADRPPSMDALRQALSQALECSSESPGALRVLLVDDDQNTLVAVRELMQLAFPCAEVTMMSDPASAIAVARREAPDIVITDLHMPHGGGQALTRALREHPATRDVPIVVVTAYGGASDWHELRAMGADRFLLKPVDFDTLASQVRSLTGARGGRTRRAATAPPPAGSSPR